MTEVNKDVDPAEAFRAAADMARKALETGTGDGTAPSSESGSSPVVGAESVVPAVATVVTEGVGDQNKPTEVKPEGVVIDQEAAWNEYKTDEERKKALVSNKTYAAEMSRKARELEAKASELETKLAALEAAKPAKTEPEVKAEPEAGEVGYDEWIAKALKEPDTDEKRKIASLANEYNQYLAEKITPAAQVVEDHSKKVREAAELLKEREVALKFLQTRKDPALYAEDIQEAKEQFQEARITLSDARVAAQEAKDALREAESTRLAMLGILRKDARTSHEIETTTRRDSVSAKRLEEETRMRQKSVDEAWENAKLEAVKARGVEDETTKQFLLNAADGAIVRVASSNRSIPVEEYSKFIEESWKPFQLSSEKVRQDAVKKAIDISSEPTPNQATSEKPNVDAQPTNYEEWKRKSRAILSGRAA